MSITKETALAHAGDKAVTCCRFEAGSVIEASILEDPAIFPDLLETGLLEFPTDALSIGEVLGGKLKATLDALTPLTPAVVELPAVSALTSQAPVPVQPAASVAPQVEGSTQGTQYIHIHIGEGRDIDLKIPVGMGLSQGMAAPAAPSEPEYSEQVLRSLKRSYIRIEEIRRGPETKIQGTTLFIREGIEHDAVASQELVTDLKLEIITPADYSKYSETIMDVQPVAVKVEGELGVGVTRVIDGAVLVVTVTVYWPTEPYWPALAVMIV